VDVIGYGGASDDDHSSVNSAGSSDVAITTNWTSNLTITEEAL
jgi:hypothetical protein